jgi:hypothetical protein
LISLRPLALTATQLYASGSRPALIRTSHIVRGFTTSPAQQEDQQRPQTQAVSNWDDYFKLRAKRRNYERICCVPSSIAALAAAGSYFTQLEIDPLHTVFGMEALPVYGMATVLAVCTQTYKSAWTWLYWQISHF